MKQLPLNVAVSALLLAAVFVVANQGPLNATASTTQLPGIMTDHLQDGRMRLHGFGFRPGSLVTLTLKPRDGGVAISSQDAWVDARGTFNAEFDLERTGPQMASLDESGGYNSNDLVIVASASTGLISVPVAADRTMQ